MQYKALDMIHDEHRALAAMLNGMRTIAVGIRDGRLKMDFGLYAAMLRYMEEVPEKLHHPKEGEYLFARLRQRCEAARAVLAHLEQEHAANASRIAACVNACEGITTERLEDLGRPLMKHLIGCDERAARQVKEAAALTAQRDELLSALKVAEESVGDSKSLEIVRAAIAKVEGTGA